MAHIGDIFNLNAHHHAAQIMERLEYGGFSFTYSGQGNPHDADVRDFLGYCGDHTMAVLRQKIAECDHPELALRAGVVVLARDALNGLHLDDAGSLPSVDRLLSAAKGHDMPPRVRALAMDGVQLLTSCLLWNRHVEDGKQMAARIAEKIGDFHVFLAAGQVTPAAPSSSLHLQLAGSLYRAAIGIYGRGGDADGAQRAKVRLDAVSAGQGKKRGFTP